MTSDRHRSNLWSWIPAGLLLAAALATSDAWEPRAEPVLSDRATHSSGNRLADRSKTLSVGERPDRTSPSTARTPPHASAGRKGEPAVRIGPSPNGAVAPDPSPEQDGDVDANDERKRSLHRRFGLNRPDPDDRDGNAMALSMPERFRRTKTTLDNSDRTENTSRGSSPVFRLVGYSTDDAPPNTGSATISQPMGLPPIKVLAPPEGEPDQTQTKSAANLVDPMHREPSKSTDAVNWVPNHGTTVEHMAPTGPLSRLRSRLESRPRPLRLAFAPAAADALTADRARFQPRGPEAGAPAWPIPAKLIESIGSFSGSAKDAEDQPDVTGWRVRTADRLESLLDTAGPRDAQSVGALARLAESVQEGLALAELRTDASTSVEVRRTALAIMRRIAVWKAAAGLFQSPVDVQADAHDRSLAEYLTVGLLDLIERFEQDRSASDGGMIAKFIIELRTLPLPSAIDVANAADDHYRSANLRITARQAFIDRLMPEPVVETGPVNEMILGRRVRGTRTVTRATSVRLSPDPEAVQLLIEVRGAIDSRTLTSAGPVEVQSRASSTFEVNKSLRLSAAGFEVGEAQATAKNRSRRDSLSTSFDSVPVMRSVVRSIARSQHAESVPEANREVLQRITDRASREVDSESTPRLAAIETNVRERLWGPMVSLGLDPTPLGLETTDDMVSIRLRLAGASQLAAHSPRPTPPSAAVMAVQLHDSSLNNAVAGFGVAGRRLSLAQLGGLIAGQLGVSFEEPMDDDVFVTFTADNPVSIQATDGLIKLRLAMDALDSPRRSWEDIVVNVAYRPVVEGMQIYLQREGTVRLSGEGQRGRLELALRAIFSTVFPKEKTFPLLPARIVENPRMAGLHPVQAEAEDGWLAIAIGPSSTSTIEATVERGPAGTRPSSGTASQAREEDRKPDDLPRRRAAILSRVRRF